MSSMEYGAAPVLDMITFGYRKLVKHLIPLTVLALLPILATAFEMANINELLHPPVHHVHGHDAGMAVLQFYQQHWVEFLGSTLFISLMSGYYTFVLYAYVKDVYLERVEDSILNYLIPKRVYLGLLGIQTIFFFAGGMAVVVVIVGFILLILPGIAAVGGVMFLAYRYIVSGAAYVMEPEKGVWNAMQSSWRLTRGNVWRGIALMMALIVINGIVKTPFSILEGILTVVEKFLTVKGAEMMWMHATHVGLLALTYWSVYVLGLGGTTFVMIRYYFDLKARKDMAAEALMDMAPEALSVDSDSPAIRALNKYRN